MVRVAYPFSQSFFLESHSIFRCRLTTDGFSFLLCGGRILLTSTSEVYGDPLEHPQTEEYWGNVNPIGKFNLCFTFAILSLLIEQTLICNYAYLTLTLALCRSKKLL
jgi:hypothetical protein